MSKPNNSICPSFFHEGAKHEVAHLQAYFPFYYLEFDVKQNEIQQLPNYQQTFSSSFC